ncbi:MAG TPA: two-component system response regulator [Rhodospirillaceae bacterium]|jgi:two-component system chemotaxis response regulator CheY|nr:response regulator [Alphaproteobacteria bacterium]HBH25951.1 two-component system response regulator [Rhodospirillaceae bacterium]
MTNKTCLIVDDSGIVRKVIRGHLESMGFVCSEAEDGATALRHCVAPGPKPDLIMLDWNMPVMTGIEFLRALRVIEGGDAPIVIFCTTENTMAKMCEAMEAGAQDFIMKPFDREILQVKLEQNGLLEGG